LTFILTADWAGFNLLCGCGPGRRGPMGVLFSASWSRFR
jgi:hypothetical protein